MAKENVFYDILERKNGFLGYKNKKFKNSKSGFGPKMAIFPTFFFQEIQATKTSFRIFQNEKTPFQAIKAKSSKSQKIDIFPKRLIHGFGLKIATFPTHIFKKIQSRKMSFTIFYNKKIPFQAIKTRSLKTRNINIFSMGLTHGFGPKIAISPTFFFRIYMKGKCLLRYSRTKKCLSRL